MGALLDLWLTKFLNQYSKEYKFESGYMNTVEDVSEIVNMFVFIDDIEVTNYDYRDHSDAECKDEFMNCMCDISNGEHRSVHTLISIYLKCDEIELEREHYTIILQHCCGVYGIMYEE